MRRIAICFAAASLVGCASANGERQPASKAGAASADAGAPAAASSPAPAASSANAPAMTAADAAEKAHEAWVRGHRSAAAPQK
jgi:hypothetical protein